MTVSPSTEKTGLDVESLLAIVQQNNIPPLDAWHVAAILELNGIKDTDAQRFFNSPNIFRLAESLFTEHLTNNATSTSFALPVSRTNLVRQFFELLFSHVPVVIQLVSLFAVGYLVVTSPQPFPSELLRIQIVVTTIAFVVAGGPMMVLAQVSHRIPSWVWLFLVAIIFAATIAVIITFGIKSSTSDFAIYGFVLVVNIIAHGLVKVSQKPSIALFAALIGSAASFILALTTQLPTLTSQIIGLSISAVLMYVWCYFRHQTGSQQIILPAKIIRAFIYGTVYFAFLAISRLILYLYLPMGGDITIYWAYELGYVMAYIPFFFCLLFIEIANQVYTEATMASRNKYSVTDIKGYVQDELVRYWRYTMFVLVTAILLNMLVYLFLVSLEVGILVQISFLWLALGSTSLLWMLLNINLTPSLMLSRSTIIILLVSLGVHIVASLIITPPIAGFAIAAFLCALLTCIKRVQLILEMDYALYRWSIPFSD